MNCDVSEFELDNDVSLKTICYQSCRDAMRDHESLQSLVDNQARKIKELELRNLMISAGDLMMVNTILTESAPPSFPLDQLQVIVAHFLSSCRHHIKSLETKMVGFSMHFLHEFETNQTAIFPFMIFEFWGKIFVFSAYVSDDGITMWYFTVAAYQASMEYARAEGLIGHDIRERIVRYGDNRDIKRKVIDNIWRTMHLNQLSTSKLHCYSSKNMMYKTAAETFVNDFKEEWAGIWWPKRALAAINVLDLHPFGLFYSPEEDHLFPYEINLSVKPFVIKAENMMAT